MTIEEKCKKYLDENELEDSSDGYTYADNTRTEAERAYLQGAKDQKELIIEDLDKLKVTEVSAYSEWYNNGLKQAIELIKQMK